MIYGGNAFCAFEVKNAVSVHRSDLRGLKAFKDDYPEARSILLCCGDERLIIDSIECVPCEKFLLRLVPGKDIAHAL